MNELKQKIDAIYKELSKRKKVEGDVCLVGVTKFQDFSLVKEAAELGLLDLAVNYAQEGEKLRSVVTQPNIRWHFIGHIQSRKVKYLDSYQMIQSLDRLEIAESLHQRLLTRNKKLDVLIEINIGEEDQKSGILVKNLEKFLLALGRLPTLRVRGFMIMPPAYANIEERRPYFKSAKNLFDQYQKEFTLNTLSMGTSDDYLVAVEEGSNMVRLGTTLFGMRKLK